MMEVVGDKFLETKPVGVRHDDLDPKDVAWEDLPECEIFKDPMPDQSG